MWRILAEKCGLCGNNSENRGKKLIGLEKSENSNILQYFNSKVSNFKCNALFQMFIYPQSYPTRQPDTSKRLIDDSGQMFTCKQTNIPIYKPI